MLFSDWSTLGRIILVGTLAYLSLVLLLRVTGKRTLSKMNAFDLIVTVALGSTLATVLLSKDAALVDGVVAFALLIGLQYIITWLSVRSQTISRLVKATPTLLLYRGEVLHDALRRTRVVEAEVLASVRESGYLALEQVEAVVLETDGTFSVIQRSEAASPDALSNLSNYSDSRQRRPARREDAAHRHDPA